MLGRFRRRMATLSLCSLLAAGACPQLLTPSKVLRLCSLAVQVGRRGCGREGGEGKGFGAQERHFIARRTVGRLARPHEAM
jgi:hypothetical protein